MSPVNLLNYPTIKSWPIFNGTVHLKTTKHGLIAVVEQNERISHIRNEWIQGVPQGMQRDPDILGKYLMDTYVRLTPLQEGFILRINPRLKGGMFGAIGGFFSSVSSTMNFFTSSNYIKLAKTAGSEARATIRVGGVEARATIDKAEDSAKKTLNTMGVEVRSSIDRAQKGAKEVLETASSEMIKTIEMAGLETRYTSKIMELQAEKILGRASREAQFLLETAGAESGQAIFLCGEEARKTSLVLSREMTANLQTARQETMKILSQGGFEVREILDKATQDVKEIIHIAGEEYAQKSSLVIKQAFSQAEQVIHTTIQLANQKASGLIEQLGKEAQGVILNLGNMGQILIKDTGKEIRLIADDVLKKAFAGQQMTIQVAGEEARLTVQSIGQELRSTLYEIPLVAAMVGEHLGRNFVQGIKDGLFGLQEGELLNNRLKNLQGTQCNINNLLKFIYDQHQLPPQKKYQLYHTLISLFNQPAIHERERSSIMLFIGAAALDDEGLMAKSSYYVLSGTDFRAKVIAAIPGEAGKLLKEQGQKAIQCLLPKTVPEATLPVEEVNPFEIECERKNLKIKSQENALLNVQSENQFLLALSEEEKKRADLNAQEAALRERSIQELLSKVNELANLVRKQEKEIAFLQTSS